MVQKEIPATTPSGAEIPVKLTVVNTGKIAAKKVTVCLRLDHSLAFVTTRRGHIVRDGACWRVVRVVPKAKHRITPVARSFPRHVRVVACNRVTLEVRGVDLRNVRACTVVLVVEKGGGAVEKGGGAVKKGGGAVKKGGGAVKKGGGAVKKGGGAVKKGGGVTG